MRSAVVLEPDITGIFLIVPSEFDEEDLEALNKAVTTDHSGVTVIDVLKEAKAGSAQMWRLQAPGTRAIVVTKVCPLRHDKKPELVIWLLGGHGVHRHGKKLIARLTEFARSQGCGEIRATCVEGVAYWLGRVCNFDHVYSVMIREV